MKILKFLGAFTALFSAIIVPAATPSPKMITGPNTYGFVSSTFYTPAGATKASITVVLQPGNPSYVGSVGYTTIDGTAVAGQDYTPVSGTLTFDSPAWQHFDIPLLPS